LGQHLRQPVKPSQPVATGAGLREMAIIEAVIKLKKNLKNYLRQHIFGQHYALMTLV